MWPRTSGWVSPQSVRPHMRTLTWGAVPELQSSSSAPGPSSGGWRDERLLKHHGSRVKKILAKSSQLARYGTIGMTSFWKTAERRTAGSTWPNICSKSWALELWGQMAPKIDKMPFFYSIMNLEKFAAAWGRQGQVKANTWLWKDAHQKKEA